MNETGWDTRTATRRKIPWLPTLLILWNIFDEPVHVAVDLVAGDHDPMGVDRAAP